MCLFGGAVPGQEQPLPDPGPMPADVPVADLPEAPTQSPKPTTQAKTRTTSGNTGLYIPTG